MLLRTKSTEIKDLNGMIPKQYACNLGAWAQMMKPTVVSTSSGTRTGQIIPPAPVHSTRAPS